MDLSKLIQHLKQAEYIDVHSRNSESYHGMSDELNNKTLLDSEVISFFIDDSSALVIEVK